MSTNQSNALCILVVHDEFNFSGEPTRFSLEGPRGVVVASREDLVELDLARADEIIEGERVAVPDTDRNLAEALNEGDDGLLLKHRVLASISAGAGSEFGRGIFETNIWVLPRNPLGILQFAATHHCDLQELALDP